MKILLDECVDRRFARDLAIHEVRTVPQMEWAAFKNGTLLSLAAANAFDAFITVDRNLSAQQNLSRLSMAVIVLKPRSVRLADLRLLLPKLLAVLETLPGDLGTVVEV